jgi:hypothetical protein
VKLFVGVTVGIALIMGGLLLLFVALTTDAHQLAVQTDPAGLVDSESNSRNVLLVVGGLGVIAIGGGVALVIASAKSNRERGTNDERTGRLRDS